MPLPSAPSALPLPPAVRPVSALEEQRLNEQALAAPLDAPLLRAWSYPHPALVLGRGQQGLAAAGRDDGRAALPVLVRGAGGGAVLTGPWLLSLALTLPPDDARVAGVPVADSYRWLGQAFTRALSQMGVAARAAAPHERVAAPAHLAWACFAGVGAWEVFVPDAASGRPRKLAGFAQRRSRHGVLLAAGVLLSCCPWLRMSERMGLPDSQAQAQAGALAACTVDLSTLCGQPVDGDTFVQRLWPHVQPMRAG